MTCLHCNDTGFLLEFAGQRGVGARPEHWSAGRLCPAAGVLVTNEEVIRREVGMVVRFGGAVVAAWGAHKVDPLFSTDVQEIAQSAGWPLQCWGTTKDGHPRHPLYLPADAERVRWPE